MSYAASIIIRGAAESPEDVATQVKNLIASRFSTAEKFPSVWVNVTPIKQRRDFGLAEIDVTQSRDSSFASRQIGPWNSTGTGLKTSVMISASICVAPAARLILSYSTRIPMRNRTIPTGKGKKSS